jgi:patatin-like phospholipase/acyl hydrolase
MSSFTILSFVGGGIRGLASATLLNALFEKHSNVVSGASMLAGTSTGGTIIAALVNGVSTQEIVNTYRTTDREFYIKYYSGGDPTKPAYPVDLFAAGMYAKYGLQKLSDKNQKLLFTTFDVGQKGTPWQPLLLHNFPNSPTADTKLADAVVATSAMPGMFGSHKFGDYQGTIDGAFVNHDPTLAAIALAINSGVNPSDIVAICFGTGLMANSLGSATQSWGFQQWQTGDPDNPYNVPPLLINGLPSPVLNASLNGTSTSLIPDLARMMLPGRYAYLNPTLPNYIPENETNNLVLDELEGLAKAVTLTPEFDIAKRLVKDHWSLAI